jgi:hypothetical protein
LDLERESQRRNARYLRDGQGVWRCPTGDSAVAAWGLRWVVRSPSDIDAIHLANLDFLQRVVLPLARRSGLMEGKTYDRLDSQSRLLGLIPFTKWFVTELTNLSGVRDLHCLTMVTWKDTFAAKGLLRRKRAWCVHCFEEARTGGAIPYDRLAWALNAIKVCARHATVLSTVCPSCHRESRWLTSHMQPGRCGKCGQWLGRTRALTAGSSQLSNEFELETQVVIAKQVGALLEATQSTDVSLSRVCFQSVLKGQLASLTPSTVSELAYVLGISVGVARKYCLTTSTLTVEGFLRVCSSLQQPPLALLVDTVSLVDVSGRHTALPISPLRHPKGERYSRDELALMQATLVAILNAPGRSVPCLTTIATGLGCCSGVLYRHFPELCVALVARNNRRHADTDKIAIINAELTRVLTHDDHVSLKEVARRCHCSYGVLKRSSPRLCNEVSRRNDPACRRAIVHRRLEKVLQESEPRSVAACAREWQVSVHWLQESFPELSHAGSAKYREGLRERCVRRKQAERQGVIDAVRKLYARGIYPSQAKVAEELGRSGSHFRQRHVLQAFQNTRAELGLRRGKRGHE